MPYTIPYLALVALATPLAAGAGATLAWLALSLSLLPLMRTVPAPSGMKEKHVATMGIIALIVFAISRALPLLRWGASGLGADIAAYHMSFGRCFAAWSACAAYPVAGIMKPLFMLGVPTDTILITLLIAANAALGIAICAAAWAHFGKEAAAWSGLVFAASLPQFLAYWSFFLSMQIALALGFLGTILWKRRSGWAWAAFLAQGIIHFVTFTPFTLALATSSALGAGKEGRRGSLAYALKTLGIASLGILAYHGRDLMGFAGAAERYATGSYGMESAVLLAGHFVTLDFYHGALILFYIPFALIVCAQSVESRNLLPAALATIMPLMLAASGIIFHNRFLIIFDAMAIMMAGEGMRRFAASQNAVAKKLVFAACALVCAYAMRESWRMEPLVNAAEFSEIRAIGELKEVGEIPVFVNNALYRQFIAGYSGKEVRADAFSRLPWLQTESALIYNARRSPPFEPNGDPHYERMGPETLLYRKKI